MVIQHVIHHTSAGPLKCDAGQEHEWRDVSYHAYGVIRTTAQACRRCQRATVLRNDGSNIILRLGDDQE